MRAAGTILGGAGGGETVYTDPTASEAIADLADGKWIRVKASGQLPAAASTYADALLLGTIPEGTAWSVHGRWSASFVSVGNISGGIQVFRGVVSRPVGGNAGNADLDIIGTSGGVSGQLINFSLSTNAITLQLRITAALAYTYNLDFRMQQLAQPV